MDTVKIILNLISEKNMTEQKFLSDMGFNRTLLSDWKSGKSRSYMRHLSKIATYFGVSTDYLLGNTDIKNKPAATEDDELLKLLDNPINREIFDKMSKLTPENFDLIRAQIDFLTSRQERTEDK